MADKRKLLELDIDVESIIAKSVQLKTTLDSLRASQDVLKKSGDTNSDTYVKLAAQISKTSSEYGLNQKQLSNLAQVSGNYLNINQKVGLSLDKEVKSISEARANNTELLKIRNELNLSKIEEAKLAAEINAKLDVNNKFIKENVSQYEQQKIGIGDYKTAIVGALQESGLFGGQLQNITQYSSNFTGIYSKMKSELTSSVTQIKNAGAETDGLGKAQKAGAIATELGTGALRIFKLALAATGIGLLVIGVGLLVNGLSKLDPVMDTIEQATAGIGGAIDKSSQIVVKFVSNITSIGDAFSKIGNLIAHPIDSIKSFSKEVGEAAKQAAKLKEAEQDLGDLKEIYEVRTKNLESQIALDKIRLKSKDLTSKEEIEIEKRMGDNTIKINGMRNEINDKTAKQALDLAKETTTGLTKEEYKRLAESIKVGDLLVASEMLNGKRIVNGKIEATSKLTKDAYAKVKEAIESQIDGNNRAAENEERNQDKIEKAQAKAEANAQAAEAAAQKRRDEAAKAIDTGIAKSKTELDLFIAQQGTRAKSLEDGLKLEEEIRDKKLAIAKKEFDSKKITQTEFELQSLNIKNEFLKKQADATVANAQMELTDFIDNNKSKLDNNQFLTDELVAQELDRINRVSEAKAKEATTRLEEGKINEKEYAAAIKVIDDKVVEDNKAVTEAKVAADVEKTAIDLDNKIAATANEFEAKQLELDNNLAQELAAAEKSGASKKLIEDKYALAQKQLDKSVQDAKLSGISNALGMAAGLFKEHTAAYKALAIAQTMIQTYQSATLAYSSAFLPIPTIASPALGAVFAGVAVASGLANIAKIAGVKMARGAILQGDSHANGGIPFTVDGKPGFEAEGGEAIINKKSTAQYGHLLSAINQAGGGVAFAGGGITYPTSVLNTFNQSNQGSQIDYDLLASKIGSNVAQANLSLPKPIVYTAITDINNGQNDYAQVVNGANF